MHDPLPIPHSVARQHSGWSVELAYTNGPHAATWRLDDGRSVRFVKVMTLGWEPCVEDERLRMEWAAAHLPVPKVIAHGRQSGVKWLLTAGLPGVPGTDERLAAEPAILVPILARGLRAFHDAPVQDCLFTYRAAEALEFARERVAAARVDPVVHFHTEHAHLTPNQALARLEATCPTDEDLVVCHGDYCPPNVLIEGGEVTGYVDLGGLGVADRWWDLAVATWSVTWNYGPGWEQNFLQAYGVEADTVRTAFYRLLYDLGP